MVVEGIRWKLLFYLLVFLYILSFIFLILDYEKLSLTFLFGILGLISLIPGFIFARIWRLEIMDFFVVILGVYEGILYALFYYIGFRILSFTYNKRFYNSILIYIIDYSCMISACLLLPFLYYLADKSFFLTVIYFIITRYIFYGIFIYIIERSRIFTFFTFIITDFPFIVVSTVLISFILGDTLSQKFSGGLYLDSGIFIFCTLMIGFLILFVYLLNVYKNRKVKISATYDLIEKKKRLLNIKQEKPFTYFFLCIYLFFTNFKLKLKEKFQKLKIKRFKKN